MYKTIQESLSYVKGLMPLVQDAPSRVYLAVPFTAIKPVADICLNTGILVGGQNMHDAEEGAFTGEIAGKMLKEAGACFVILGHSERRRYFGETNAFINKKILRALKDGLHPILCIGESRDERDDGHTEYTLEKQLAECLASVTPEQAEHITLAYEPIWAIGTHEAATPEIAQEVHSMCRLSLSQKFGETVAQKISILYGGSVKSDNAENLLSQPDVDGFLVGGASLHVDSFSKIVLTRTPKTT